MNIIIPLCGKGERFARAGYETPKQEIKVLGKEILRYTIDSLNLASEDRLYIVLNERTHQSAPLITTYYPNAKIILLKKETAGASETIHLALEQIPQQERNNPTLLVDADNFYTTDIISLIKKTPEKNQVICFETTNEKPIFSYIKTDPTQGNKITEIAEKRKISNYANTGAYYFASPDILYASTSKVTQETISTEPYISHAIAHSLAQNTDWYATHIPKETYFSLGTPEQVAAYEARTNGFLFDLDGTLVNTDEIYYKVWSEILAPYNISLTKEIYNTYIFSNADDDVRQKLIPTAPITTKQLTLKKDTLFLNHLHQIQTIAGAQDFIKSLHVKAHKIAVVTNANRPTAEAILKYINIRPELLVIGSECSSPKPSPEPYLTAIQSFNISPSRCIVFEDSKNGIVSARGARVQTVVGIQNDTNHSIHVDADIVISDYTSLYTNSESVEIAGNILQAKKPATNYEEIIKTSLKSKYTSITDIKVDPIYLKGGFIADVLSVTLTLDGTPVSTILKLAGENDSPLNKMAHFLNLYDRENYFYESIAPFIPIKAPKCYGLLRDPNAGYKPLGFMLEDMRPKATLNRNLSTEPIDLTLNVIAHMAKLHAAFWDKPLDTNFPQLRKHNDPTVYQPSWRNFLQEKLPTFRARWQQILSPHQLSTCQKIVENFNQIQDHLSTPPLTLTHGDIKSPNIFYEGDTPCFIDWQYIANGKGVQDLIFFLIESFSKERLAELYPLYKSYYYEKLKEYGVTNYTIQQYEGDIQAALCHFPFFVAIWFGTTPTQDLIDVNFPYFFIQKLFAFYDYALKLEV
jgi:HAD superfamily hydrolase (TIGR01509 family)